MFTIPEIKVALSFSKDVKKTELRQLNSSKESADLFREVFNKDTFDWTEEMILLCLNMNNRVVGFYKVSQGGVVGTICDPKVVFTVALNCAATSIMIAHNHPSGNLVPSRADMQLTEKIKNAGQMLDIKLLDHIILSDDSYYSFADEGVI